MLGGRGTEVGSQHISSFSPKHKRRRLSPLIPAVRGIVRKAKQRCSRLQGQRGPHALPSQPSRQPLAREPPQADEMGFCLGGNS